LGSPRGNGASGLFADGPKPHGHSTHVGGTALAASRKPVTHRPSGSQVQHAAAMPKRRGAGQTRAPVGPRRHGGVE